MLAILFLAVTTLSICGCVQSPDARPLGPEAVAIDWREELASIEQDELTYRLPNSMCQLMSDEGCDMRLELARSRTLVETRNLARRLSSCHVREVLADLQRTPGDEDCRILVIARLLAATGVGEEAIKAHLPAGAQWDNLRQVMREGRGIRELG
jgi:hypothetical protein